MAQRRRSWRRRSGAAWRGIVSRFAESGLTLREYCARERISTTSFYRARAVCGDTASGEVVGSASVTAPPAAASFLDLGTLGGSGTRLELRLDLGGGVILQIARG